MSEYVDVCQMNNTLGNLQVEEGTFHHDTSSQNGRTNGESKKYIEIIEEPLSDGYRFRYEKEGRNAGRIKGVKSKGGHITHPTIKIHADRGPVDLIVSLITIHGRYPHPHKLVGEDCKDGIFRKLIDVSEMPYCFSDLRIQCVKKKKEEVEESLKKREMRGIDPFGTGFSHSSDLNKINFNAVRLCFQALLPDSNGNFEHGVFLNPAISKPIYDSKSASNMSIKKLSHCSASVEGKKEIIILCGQVDKDDIEIIFHEEKDKEIIWTDYGDFFPHDVHYRVAISFRTPTYKTLNVHKPINCFIYLRRKSDGTIGRPRQFTLLPIEKEYKRPKLDFRKGIQQENLALENFVDKNSRPKIRAVRIAAKGKNNAGNQFHPSYIPEREFKSPGTVKVHENENYVENVPSFCNYPNTVSKAGDMSTITSPYTHDQFKEIFQAPPIHLHNAESLGGSPSTVDHTSTVISPYTQEQFENVYLVDTQASQLNNAERFGGSPSTADHMPTVVSPYAPQPDENIFFLNSQHVQLNNAETVRNSLEDDLHNNMNNSNLESNTNDLGTMSGLSITSNEEINLLNYIGAVEDGTRVDGSPPFHDNLREDAVETLTGHSLEELSSLNLNSNSSDLDTNMSCLSIDSISESVAISILGDIFDMT